MWKKGTYKGYYIEAKVYDTPSSSGINNGRVSKLTVKANGNIVAHYDRGWDERYITMGLIKEIVKAVCAA